MAPHETFEDRNLVGSRGIFLHIERGRLSDLAYSLRVEDLSGLADPYHVVRGTELPLIPQSSFGRSVTLLNVPVAGGLEKVLRVYRPTSEPMNVTIELVWAFLAVTEANDRSFTAITPGR